MKKILYVAGEALTFASSGGLGDVMGALPSAIAESDEFDVEVIMPLYATMKQEYREKLELVTDIQFNLSWRQTGASIFKYSLGSVTYYFVENHQYFDRAKFYGEYDDAERFAFFSRAVYDFAKLKTDPNSMTSYKIFNSIYLKLH